MINWRNKFRSMREKLEITFKWRINLDSIQNLFNSHIRLLEKDLLKRKSNPQKVSIILELRENQKKQDLRNLQDIEDQRLIWDVIKMVP